MNGGKGLHLRRLRENLQAIKSFRDVPVSSSDPKFQTWRESTRQSLVELFGRDHGYTQRFSKLQFFEVQVRVSMRRDSGLGLSQKNHETFENALIRAEDILKEALEEIPQVQSDASNTAPTPDPKKIFVVHGRDDRLRADFFAFLRALDLDPLEWSEALKLTGKATPYIGEVLDSAFGKAQAIIVLLTPDDEVRLVPELWSAAEEKVEKEFLLQARPNVLFEAGMAFGRHPDRTLLVEVGQVKKFSDVAGRHVVRLSNESTSRHEIAERLKTVGCAVSTTGTDWLKQGNFSVTRSAKTVLSEVDKKVGVSSIQPSSKQDSPVLKLHQTIGGPGVGNGEFRFGGGIDSNGGLFIDENYLYVTDWNNQRLQRFKLNFEGKWTYFDSLYNQEGLYSAVFVDKTGVIYLQGQGLLKKYDANKKHIEDIKIDISNFCRFIVDSNGNIFTQAGSDQNVIKKYDHKGTQVLSFGGFGSSDGKFNNSGWSVDIVSDSAGNIYMLDAGGKRAHKFDNNGNFLSKWNVEIMGCSLMAIAEKDRIYIVEKGNSHLSEYSNDGKLIRHYKVPQGVISDGAGYIFVKGNKIAISNHFIHNVTIFSIAE
ncbi:MAG: nucleotide-binding protein [Syntrophales bacterium]|nr:nucleotide-binding protein [Syntrophales bacterium]